MKANANQIRIAIDAASPDVRLYLFHGPDESGARELAARIGRALGPDAERIDLEPAQLRGNPGLLADEAAALSLFGGARHIRVTGAGEESLEAVTLLLEAEQTGNPVVVLAPTLKATAKLVKLALAHRRALCLACFLPEGGDADRLATAIAREYGLRTTGGTATRLAASSGGDRAIMTRELEKLALYLDAAPERPRELDDAALDAVGADLGDTEMSRAIEAALDGRPDTLANELAGMAEAGVSPIPVLRQLTRRLIALAEMQAEIAAGADPKALIDRVFFRERATTSRALRLWDPHRLSDAIGHIRGAERAIMTTHNPGNVVADAAVTVVARMAARQR